MPAPRVEGHTGRKAAVGMIHRHSPGWTQRLTQGANNLKRLPGLFAARGRKETARKSSQAQNLTKTAGLPHPPTVSTGG